MAYKIPRAGKGSTYHQRYGQRLDQTPRAPRYTRDVDSPTEVPAREIAWALDRHKYPPIKGAPTSAVFAFAAVRKTFNLANGWLGKPSW